MSLQSDRKARAVISTSSAGDNTIIAAPSAGYIEIDHIDFIPSGGAQTVTLKDGATTIVAYALDDNQGYAFDNTADNPIRLSDATAFVLNLGAATSVTGFVLYRIIE